MADKKLKTNVINIKLDDENKNKFETLAFQKHMSLQDLGEKLIIDAINENANIIAEIEKLRE